MKKIILIGCCLSLVFSCKKKEEPAPEPPAPTPAPTIGPISGKVTHYDQYGQSYTSGLNNTTVTIENTNFQAVTDASGKYTLKDVSAGTYTLVFSKPGTGLIKMQNISYRIGDTISHNGAVADIPTFSITNAYVKDTTWFTNPIPGVYYRATSNSTNTTASTVIIIGKSANISLANSASYDNYAQASEINKSTDFNRFISYSFLRDEYNFKKNDIIFMKVYPVSTLSASYIDAKLKKPIYTAFGAAYPTTFTLTMP